MTFAETWKRITEATEIRSQYDLAEKLGMTQAVVSKWKRRDIFPAEWAYKIAKQYGLLTEWIITGEGPKRLREENNDKSKEGKERSRGIVEEWGRFLVESGQEARVVLRLSRESADFSEWLSQQEEDEQVKKSQAA